MCQGHKCATCDSVMMYRVRGTPTCNNLQVELHRICDRRVLISCPCCGYRDIWAGSLFLSSFDVQYQGFWMSGAERYRIAHPEIVLVPEGMRCSCMGCGQH